MQTAFTEAIAIARNRRSFIGGSDARIIIGGDEGELMQLWREKRGEIESKELSGNLVVHSGKRLKSSIGDGSRPTVVRKSSMCRCTSGIRSCSGWAQRSMAASEQAEPSSRLSSCYLGPSRKKPQ